MDENAFKKKDAFKKADKFKKVDSPLPGSTEIGGDRAKR